MQDCKIEHVRHAEACNRMSMPPSMPKTKEMYCETYVLFDVINARCATYNSSQTITLAYLFTSFKAYIFIHIHIHVFLFKNSYFVSH